MSPIKRIVIIGGGSAGTSCAFFIRKYDKESEITVIEKGKNNLYSPCALPYLISGEINKEDIFIFSENDYKLNNISLMLNTEVKKVNTKEKSVLLSNEEELKYDFLVVATGSKTRNVNKEYLRVFKRLEDFETLEKEMNKKLKVSVIGAGFVGVEVAISLSKRGHDVTIIEMEDNVLSNYFDIPISKRVEEHLSKNKVNLFLGTKTSKIDKNYIEIDKDGGKLKIEHDLAFSCTGFDSSIDLIKETDIKTNKGIIVDSYLRTSIKDVFACGDCVEYKNFITKENEVSMLGSVAVAHAKIVAQNITGLKREMPQNLNNFVSKLGDKFIGSVGLTKKNAECSGIKTVSAVHTSKLYPEYSLKKEEITYILTSDTNGKIIGGQIVSDENIAGKLNALSLAISKECSVDELKKAQTCYNPLSAPVIDPLVTCAETLSSKIDFFSGSDEN